MMKHCQLCLCHRHDINCFGTPIPLCPVPCHRNIVVRKPIQELFLHPVTLLLVRDHAASQGQGRCELGGDLRGAPGLKKASDETGDKKVISWQPRWDKTGDKKERKAERGAHSTPDQGGKEDRTRERQVQASVHSTPHQLRDTM